jgi:hypothetical protein
MKILTCLSLPIAFLLLVFCGCQDEPTEIQNDLSVEQGSGGFAKPPAGQLKCSLVVTPHDRLIPVSLPVSPVPSPKPVMIHYEISGPNPITSATIWIIYDDNQDGNFNISHAERVRAIRIPCDGTQRTMIDDIGWNGEVDEAYSASGDLFDHYASTNPDWYLFNFGVFDSRGNFASTGGGTCPDNARAYVNPSQTVPEFHITSVNPIVTPKKGRYVAELKATVACESQGLSANLGFTGSGCWVQVVNGVEQTPSVYNGSLCSSFSDDGNQDGAGTTTATLQVGPGTYRFYVILLYSPYYSYDPTRDVKKSVDITVP